MNDYPRLTVITPSYNQADFLDRTICSVLNQGYPNVEYIIIDGGSTDGSVEIIKKYADRLTYWESTPDNGQAHAINKGLQRATGDWIAWQNSDDIFYPHSFEYIAQAIKSNVDANLVIGDINLIDEHDKVIRPMRYVRPTYKSLLAEGMVLTNQAAFWKRSVHTEIGWLDENLHFGFDYEWFLRLLKDTNSSTHIPKILGALRYHNETKTSLNQEDFKTEYALILTKHDDIRPNKVLYQLRRTLLTLLNGNFLYFFKGLFTRAVNTFLKNTKV